MLLQDIIDNQSGPAAANGTVLEWGWTGARVDWIRADRDRLQHILMNVIGNAVKFTQGGHVTVNLAKRVTEGDTPVLDISVRDTGIGMDAQLKAQIFDDFMTGDSSYGRNVGGTGLGLGIAQRFAKALDGDISVESAPGKGSTFTISLPLVPVEEPEARPERRKNGDAAKPSTILLVEDNEINRFVAREMLTAAGHRVTEAQNGKVAVDFAGDTAYDLILMDISMPIMDGRAATRAIRAGNGPSAQTPIVALTANAMAEEQEAFLSDGMNDVLTKPLTRDGLIRVIADHVQSEKPERSTSAVPGVALSYLDDLRASLGREALKPLLDRFVAEMDETLKVLADHANLPFDQIARSAHRVAGSAATVGAVDLRVMLVAAEDAAKEQDRTRGAEAVAALPDIWAATRPFMRAEGRHGAQKWATAG